MLRTKKVDLRDFNRQMKELEAVGNEIMPDVLRKFKEETPVRSGRARRNTRRESNRIIADYPYAERLDQGASRQAPDGMTEPTIKFIEQEFAKRLRGL